MVAIILLNSLIKRAKEIVRCGWCSHCERFFSHCMSLKCLHAPGFQHMSNDFLLPGFSRCISKMFQMFFLHVFFVAIPSASSTGNRRISLFWGRQSYCSWAVDERSMAGSGVQGAFDALLALGSPWSRTNLQTIVSISICIHFILIIVYNYIIHVYNIIIIIISIIIVIIITICL